MLDKHSTQESELIKKFFKKYPEIKQMPIMGPMVKNKNGSFGFSHPASIFVWRQKKLMDKGYSENKSFQMVEKQIEGILTK